MMRVLQVCRSPPVARPARVPSTKHCTHTCRTLVLLLWQEKLHSVRLDRKQLVLQVGGQQQQQRQLALMQTGGRCSSPWCVHACCVGNVLCSVGVMRGASHAASPPS